ncbi:MAG: metal-sulfur cluster assembly factor [Nitrospinota bacterium]
MELGTGAEERIREALRSVVDPELGINVVDLGLVYHVEARDGRARVVMTLTTPACPIFPHLRSVAETAIRERVPDVRAVDIELVWEPPWEPAMMSEAARRQLGGGE